MNLRRMSETSSSAGRSEGSAEDAGVDSHHSRREPASRVQSPYNAPEAAFPRHSRLAHVVEKAREKLQWRHEQLHAETFPLRCAIEAYVDALEDKLLCDFADMAGLDVEWPRKTPEATAMALREIVLGLPELALGAANATPALASDARAAVASDGQYEARGRERESTPEAAPAPEVPTCESPLAGQPDAAGQALLAQFYETEFDTLGDADFASYATEFAARARHYQQTHPGAQIDIASKIIRPLTAMTYKRDLPQRLFGLSREDVGEWEAIANRAREARERRDKATISGALTHRMLLPSTLVLAEAAPTGAEEGEDIDDKSIDLPALRALAEQGEIAIVGGLLGNERLEHWNRRAGIPFNWVKVDDRKLAAVTRLTTRIRGGRVVALVILTGVLNHKAYEPLIAAARAVDLPVGYARAAGQAELVTVLTDLDRRVRSGGTRDGESGALAE